MVDIKRLLKKKSWTGKEIGQIILVDTLKAYKRAIDTSNPLEQPEVTKEQLDYMVSTLTNESEWETYRGYISIYDWIQHTSQLVSTQEQSAIAQYAQYYGFIANALTAENTYQYIAELPVTMTEKQYTDFLKKRIQEILKPNGQDRKDSAIQLILKAIDYYINLLETHPRAKNPLKPLKKKLQEEPIADLNILKHYNNAHITTVASNNEDDIFSVFADIDKDPNQSPEEKEKTKFELLKLMHKVLAGYQYTNGLTPEEAQERIQKEALEGGYIKEVTPENIPTKWEILTNGDLSEYYQLIAEEKKTPEEKAEVISTFYSIFPEVVKALLKDIEDKYKLTEIKKLPLEKWLDALYSWEGLYKLDFYGFKEAITKNSVIFEGNQRALKNGIAIIKPSPLENLQRIDPKTGYYTPPDISQTMDSLSLLSFMPEHKAYREENVQIVANAKRLLIGCYYFIEGYNTALDIIKELYDVEEVDILKRPTEWLTIKMENLNNVIYLLYSQIGQTDYEDPILRERKREVLRENFQPMFLEKLKIPKARLDKAKKDMRDFKVFRDTDIDPYLQLCFYYPEEHPEEKDVIESVK